VREFIELAAREINMDIIWRGKGVDEKGYTRQGTCVVAIDPRYYRPAEVETLLGDPTRARSQLGWKPKVTFRELIREMIEEDMRLSERDALNQQYGFKTYSYNE
jgi:GDPmannose 4,6-dehydratase